MRLPGLRRRGTFRPDPPLIPTALKVLLGLLAVVAVVALLIYPGERHARTAEADAEILSLDFPGSPYPGVPGGHNVRYRFVVGGVTYVELVRRSWSVSAIEDAKVCYEPGNPANNSLERATTTCA